MTKTEPLAQVKTKIIATVGPASESASMLRELALAGVDLFRLNLAHGTEDWHRALIQRIRAVSREFDRPLGILVDLAGPKIRLGEILDGEMQCHQDDPIELVAEADPNQPGQITTTYPPLLDALQVGDPVLLADGTVELRVEAKKAGSVLCRVTLSGRIRSGQGVHAPGVKLNVPALTGPDRDTLRAVSEQPVDFVGLSFVGEPSDVADLRQELSKIGCHAQVVSKIERAEALDHIEAIVDSSDAVMVARGDLGVAIDPARVPAVQKQIIALCNQRRVPVITATQMLDSMRYSPRPTRAEASDVANAILDGSDAMLLSGETAVGQFPVETVATMSRIARETEGLLQQRPSARSAAWDRPIGVEPVTEAVVHGASRVAETLRASLVIVATHSGRTALAMSKHRNFVPTIATSDLEQTLQRMCLYWGVTPLRVPQIRDPDALMRYVVTWGRQKGLLRQGDRIVLLASTHWTPAGHNMILVHEVNQ